MSDQTPQIAGDGHRQVRRALGLAAITWAVLALQVVALFGRPSPYGGPYATVWTTYFFYALAFRMLTVWGVALPFLGWWAWRGRRTTGTRETLLVHGLLAILLALLVAYDHADNEVMRFMGTHLTADFLRTYGGASLGESEVIGALVTDRGGPLSSVAILLFGPLLVVLAFRWWWRRPAAAQWLTGRGAILAAALLPFLGTLVVYNLPGGKFRRERVQGALLTQVRDLIDGREAGLHPADFPELVAEYQRDWLAEDGSAAWHFSSDTTYPLRRSPVVPSDPPATGRWNVLYLQLETFRGWNVGHLRPDLTEPSATPFLDSLASSPGGAYWTRALSFGPPTINGFMAGHCSVPPHSLFHVATRFTSTRLDCLPTVLRRHHWRTLLFSASDPDWDNQTPWIRAWYDEHHYYPEAKEADRIVFRLAAERIRAAAADGRPFFASVSSISNHYPFETREPALALNQSSDPRETIRNTMRYTDDVVREFVATLAQEPWFGRTVIVIVGDHGYNLGEHDGERGQRNGYRESLWIPLIIAGGHPGLPHGAQTGVASLLDIAPTIAELVGIREPTSWVGHNLVAGSPPASWVGFQRPSMLFAEQGRFSLVGDPGSGVRHLFDALADPLQQQDVAGLYADSAMALWNLAERRTRLFDYLLAANRIVPPEEDSALATAGNANRAAPVP